MPLSIEPLNPATPPCPHFGPCGGCQLQHLAYSAQLAYKSGLLRAHLETTGIALPEIQIHPSAPLAYRNRIRLTLAEVDGRLRAGYIRRSADHKTGCPTSGSSDVGFEDGEDLHPIPASASASFLPIRECPIAAPILWRAAEALLALIDESAIAWLRNPRQIPDQLELFTTADESRLQLTLYLRTAAKTAPAKLSAAFNTLCDKLLTIIPEFTGAGISLLPTSSTQRSRRTEQSRPGPAWGSPGLNYSVPDPRNPTASTTYWVPRGAFFQANRFLIPELLHLVTGHMTSQLAPNLAFDLYAGVGLFSRALAARYKHVAAVEIAEPAATALASTRLPNLRAVKATTLDFLRAAVLDRDRPDLVVLDPPRSGAGAEVCALLARIAAPTVVYVSCSPDTLPRDLKTLTASGYTVAELHLLDLFPQTTHIEAFAILTR